MRKTNIQKISEPISNIWKRFTELKDLKICRFLHLLFHKTFHYQFGVSKLLYIQSNIYFNMWFKNFENYWFTSFLHRYFFVFVFCHYVFLVKAPSKFDKMY